MKEEFLEYFKSVGMKEAVLARIETIMECFSRLLPGEEIIDVYVSEYVEADGTRKYESLRLIGKKRHFLALDFMNKDSFWLGDIREELTGVKIEATNYDFKKATSMSRLYIRKFHVYESLSEYKASMENCDQLMRIFEKYVIPNLVPI